MSQRAPGLEVNLPEIGPNELIDDYIKLALLPFLRDQLKEIRLTLSNIGPVNLDAYYETGITTPGVADTEFTITHNLGHVPKIVIWNVDTHSTIRDSQRANWTTTQLFLKCSGVSVGLTVLVL